jgi:hypothetical protein
MSRKPVNHRFQKLRFRAQLGGFPVHLIDFTAEIRDIQHTNPPSERNGIRFKRHRFFDGLDRIYRIARRKNTLQARLGGSRSGSRSEESEDPPRQLAC